MEKSLQNKTVREMFADMERHSSDLLEHINLGFIPKVQKLVKLVRPLPNDLIADDVDDLSIRINASHVLESEQYTNKLIEKIDAYTKTVEKRVQHILTGSD